ncbi:transporter [Haladaptatus sp. CMAA 1911]|uniref:transporter n=1 Tax=unclassified Haladaptatus TaxID=2622732 RepID=UPI00375413F3
MVRTHLPLRRTVPLGIGAYLVGYLLTSVATAGRTGKIMAIELPGKYLDATSLSHIFGTSPPRWVLSGWVFYNTHLVPTSLPTADTINGFRSLTNRSFLAMAGGPFFLLYLVPPILLVGAGYVAVRTGTTPGANGPRNAGASIAVGYFPLFVVGTFAFAATAANAPVTATPDGIPAIFLGLAYPIVFGALGGMVAERRSGDGTNSPANDAETASGRY